LGHVVREAPPDPAGPRALSTTPGPESKTASSTLFDVRTGRSFGFSVVSRSRSRPSFYPGKRSTGRKPARPIENGGGWRGPARGRSRSAAGMPTESCSGIRLLEAGGPTSRSKAARVAERAASANRFTLDGNRNVVEAPVSIFQEEIALEIPSPAVPRTGNRPSVDDDLPADRTDTGRGDMSRVLFPQPRGPTMAQNRNRQSRKPDPVERQQARRRPSDRYSMEDTSAPRSGFAIEAETRAGKGAAGGGLHGTAAADVGCLRRSGRGRTRTSTHSTRRNEREAWQRRGSDSKMQAERRK